jgi:hypothetical protein
VFAHLAGNMRENIALTGQIDPEHCPRQHLRHRPLHHDLFFLRMTAKYIRECGTAQQMDDVDLLDIVERNTRQIFAELLAFPPRAGLSMFFGAGEAITVKRCTNEARRSF